MKTAYRQCCGEKPEGKRLCGALCVHIKWISNKQSGAGEEGGGAWTLFTYPLYPLKTRISLNHTYIPSPYRAVNCYTNQLFNAVQWNNRCLFWDPHKTHKNTVWADLGVDEWIISGWISRRWDVGLWTGLGWPRIGTGGGRLWVR